jgi:hypothetical protein
MDGNVLILLSGGEIGLLSKRVVLMCLDQHVL